MFELQGCLSCRQSIRGGWQYGLISMFLCLCKKVKLRSFIHEQSFEFLRPSYFCLAYSLRVLDLR